MKIISNSSNCYIVFFFFFATGENRNEELMSSVEIKSLINFLFIIKNPFLLILYNNFSIYYNYILLIAKYLKTITILCDVANDTLVKLTGN